MTPGSGTNPTGTVQFYDNATAIGPPESVSGGTAELTTSALALGSHPITATYSGDGNFVGSTTSGLLDQVVNRAVTSTGLTSSANPGPLGQPITYTATVTVNLPGGGIPTGKVSFTDGASPISGCQNLTLPVSAPLSVQCQQTYSADVGHSIQASYTGDSNYLSSTSGTLNESLAQATTTTAVVASTGSATYGQPVSFTATITPEGGSSANPTGSVTYFNTGNVDLGSAPVSTTTGVTTAVLSLPYLPAGPYSVTASYSGDAVFTGGSSTTPAGVTVGKVASNVAVTSSVYPVGGRAVGHHYCHHHPGGRERADRNGPVLQQRHGHGIPATGQRRDSRADNDRSGSGIRSFDRHLQRRLQLRR